MLNKVIHFWLLSAFAVACLAWVSFAVGLHPTLFRFLLVLTGAGVAVSLHAGPAQVSRPKTKWFTLVAGGLFLLALLIFAHRLRHEPEGMVDATNIWNMKAKEYALSYLAGYPFQAVGVDWGNPEYPPLYTIFLGGLAAAAGRWSVVIAYAVSAVFLAAVFWMVFDAADPKKAPFPSVIALAAVSIFPFIPLQASDLCADIPVSAFYALSVYSLAFNSRPAASGPRQTHVILTILPAFIPPLIKLEGIFMTPPLVACAAWMMRKDMNARHIVVLSAALFGVMSFLAWYRTIPPSGMYPLDAMAIFGRLSNPGRWGPVLSAFFRQSLATAFIIPIMMIWSFSKSPRWFLLNGAVLASYAAYHLIFVITPYPQEWHIGTACFRITLQLLPAFLVANLCLIAEMGYEAEDAPPAIR